MSATLSRAYSANKNVTCYLHLPEALSIARNSIMSVSYMIITIITSGINRSMHNNLVINIFLLQEISELWKLQTQYMYYYSEY